VPVEVELINVYSLFYWVLYVRWCMDQEHNRHATHAGCTTVSFKHM